jgi:hypothetical protein
MGDYYRGGSYRGGWRGGGGGPARGGGRYNEPYNDRGGYYDDGGYQGGGRGAGRGGFYQPPAPPPRGYQGVCALGCVCAGVCGRRVRCRAAVMCPARSASASVCIRGTLRCLQRLHAALAGGQQHAVSAAGGLRHHAPNASTTAPRCDACMQAVEAITTTTVAAGAGVGGAAAATTTATMQHRAAGGGAVKAGDVSGCRCSGVGSRADGSMVMDGGGGGGGSRRIPAAAAAGCHARSASRGMLCLQAVAAAGFPRSSGGGTRCLTTWWRSLS